jgi:hypothetical protein
LAAELTDLKDAATEKLLLLDDILEADLVASSVITVFAPLVLKFVDH